MSFKKNAGGGANTDYVDLLGCESCLVLLRFTAATADNDHYSTQEVYECPDGLNPATLANYTAVPVGLIGGTFTVWKTTGGKVPETVAYMGSKRYIMLKSTPTDTPVSQLSVWAQIDGPEGVSGDTATPTTGTVS